MIRIHQLSKTFRRQTVLDRLDLDLEAGQRVALIGSNGAGKTTLVRCLLGEYQHQGSVRVDGLEVRQQRQTVLRRVGFVPQLPPPLKMPVQQLLEFAAALCGSTPARMAETTARLGLDAHAVAHKPFVKLSGGQKQKLLIGIALGRDSDILILDEPAANLDPLARRNFFDLLAERPPQTLMLISSHRLDEVAALVNRVVELDQGRVVLDDCVADSLDLSARLTCRLRLQRAEPAFATTLRAWNFESGADGLEWRGEVAGADRLRFLGVLSRYAGVLSGLNLQQPETGEKS